MKKSLIYDLPVRIFHWLFAGMFIAAFFIAKNFDDESTLYPYHMLLGFCLAFIVILRIVWGFVGSRNARFSSFSLRPMDLINYFKNIFNPKSHTDNAHNPASSWITIIMMFLALGLATTGYLMTVKIYKEIFEEVHELFANAFAVAAILHVSGIILHTFRHQDGIGLSMISGHKKNSGSVDSEIPHTYRGVAIIFIILFSSFVIYLNNHYDKAAQTLTIFNKPLQLGDGDKDGEADQEERYDNDEGHDD